LDLQSEFKGASFPSVNEVVDADEEVEVEV
jgi:hypothetical protein